MDSSALKMASSINGLPYTSNILNPNKKINFGFLNSQKSVFINRVCAIYSNGSVSRSSSHGSAPGSRVMCIDAGEVLNLCFVMIRKYRRKELRSPSGYLRMRK